MQQVEILRNDISIYARMLSKPFLFNNTVHVAVINITKSVISKIQSQDHIAGKVW